MVIDTEWLVCSSALEERLLRLVAGEHVPPHQPQATSYAAEYVIPAARDKAARLLKELTKKLECFPETFARAISIMDAFLLLLKVKMKYLQCVAVTCFFIAAKLEEDIEHVPSLGRLLEASGCGCRSADIQRMELIIMQKLHFDLVHPAPLEFLQIFYTLATINGMLWLPRGLTATQHLCHVTHKLELVLCHSHFLKFRPSVLALAVLGCELKVLGCDWLTLLVSLQDRAQMKGAKLSVCWECVATDYPRLSDCK